MSKIKCTLIITSGNGPGKTCSALGLALRNLGHEKKVLIFQFFKGRKNIGEFKIQKKLKNLQVIQLGSRHFVNLRKLNENYKKMIVKGFNSILSEIKKFNAKLIILDEILLAVKFNLISENELINLLSKIPKNKVVVLTGRDPSKKLIALADYLTQFKEVKHPFKKGIKARKGIEY